MPKEFDPWAMSSGLVDAYNGKITDAYFEYDENYNDGETCVLKLEITTDDPDVGDTVNMYPCGKGWEPKDNGAKAVREDGKQASFNRNSGAGALGVALVEAGVDMRGRGLPWEASVYKGLNLEWERKEFSSTIAGEKVEWARMLPTSQLADAKPAKAPAKKAATKAEPEAEAEEATSAAPSNGNGKVDRLVRVKLLKLAGTCDTHEQFIERAFTEVDGVDGNDALEQLVMDEDGLYAEAKA